MRAKRLLVVLLLLIAAPGAITAQASKQVIPAWLEAAARRVEKDLTSGNSQDLANLYAVDAVDIESGQPAWTGRDEIAWQNAAFVKANRITSMKVVPAEFQSSGNMGYERGSYELRFTPKGGTSTVDRSNYLIVWKRQSGQWRIHRFLGSPAAAAR